MTCISVSLILNGEKTKHVRVNISCRLSVRMITLLLITSFDHGYLHLARIKEGMQVCRVNYTREGIPRHLFG